MSGTIRSERQGALALVTLSHPGKFNAMSRGMWRELRAVFGALQQDASACAASCCAARAGISAPAATSPNIPISASQEAGLRDFHENDVWGGLQAMLDCDLPVVAQIEGNCMGAGVEIACCCDIRIASEIGALWRPDRTPGFSDGAARSRAGDA